MTEEEWLSCADPQAMLEFLPTQPSRRKLRLFVCACCRLAWENIPDESNRRAIAVGEMYADGLVPWYRLAFARLNLGSWTSFPIVLKPLCYLCLEQNVAERIGDLLVSCRAGVDTDMYGTKQANQATVLRCIIGNPFRTITIDPNWLNPTVTNLATVAYEKRALPSGELDASRLAILADALEDAGCDNQDILSHLRSPVPHTRGCWSVDLCLGRS